VVKRLPIGRVEPITLAAYPVALKLLDERPGLELRSVHPKGHSRGVNDICRRRIRCETGRNRPLHAELIRYHQISTLDR